MKTTFLIAWIFIGFISALSAAGVSSKTPPSVVRFNYPWSRKTATHTGFRAFVDRQRLHFEFDVEDHDVVIARSWSGESTVTGEDRVEIFIARDADLRRYFCLEIDPLGRVHDYSARYYRKFDSRWQCEGLRTVGRRTPTGYFVKGSIPLATLSSLTGKPVGRGSVIRLGLFRAEFYGKDARTHGEADDNWLSWVDPRTPRPDFHVPSAFRDWKVP